MPPKKTTPKTKKKMMKKQEKALIRKKTQTRAEKRAELKDAEQLAKQSPGRAINTQRLKQAKVKAPVKVSQVAKRNLGVVDNASADDLRDAMALMRRGGKTKAQFDTDKKIEKRDLERRNKEEALVRQRQRKPKQAKRNLLSTDADPNQRRVQQPIQSQSVSSSSVQTNISPVFKSTTRVPLQQKPKQLPKKSVLKPQQTWSNFNNNQVQKTPQLNLPVGKETMFQKTQRLKAQREAQPDIDSPYMERLKATYQGETPVAKIPEPPPEMNIGKSLAKLPSAQEQYEKEVDFLDEEEKADKKQQEAFKTQFDDQGIDVTPYPGTQLPPEQNPEAEIFGLPLPPKKTKSKSKSKTGFEKVTEKVKPGVKKKDDNSIKTLKEGTAGYDANERLLKRKKKDFGKDWYLGEPYNMTAKEWMNEKGFKLKKNLSSKNLDIYRVLKGTYG